jgi:RNA polymerase sigma-70 factor (ECF subfamily)
MSLASPVAEMAREPGTFGCASGIFGPVEDGRDRVLLARLAAGDDDALTEVYDRYAPLVFGVAKRLVGNHGVAEDVVQEVFTTLWRHPERFDPDRGSMRAYLGVQAHRRAVDAIRSDARRRAREERCELMQPRRQAPVSDKTDDVTVAEVVRQAIARLPEGQRQAVELAYWSGRPQREMADVLGVPEGTVKSRMRLAQAKLAEWLAPLGVESL